MLYLDTIEALKKAGYPFEKDSVNLNRIPVETFKMPTLKDLIHACENGFKNLTKAGTNWRCNDDTYEDEDQEDCGGWDSEGDTPEEAVSQLYIKLKQK